MIRLAAACTLGAAATLAATGTLAQNGHPTKPTRVEKFRARLLDAVRVKAAGLQPQ